MRKVSLHCRKRGLSPFSHPFSHLVCPLFPIGKGRGQAIFIRNPQTEDLRTGHCCGAAKDLNPLPVVLVVLTSRRHRRA
jgi:hypothetical protein